MTLEELILSAAVGFVGGVIGYLFFYFVFNFNNEE